MRALILGLSLLSFSACSAIKPHWGEAPPPAKKAKQEEQTEGEDTGPAPDVRAILEGTDEQAQVSLNYWRKEILSLFQRIRGATEGELSDAEIRFLIRKLSQRSNEDFEVLIHRAFILKSFLGFADRITVADLVELMDWVQVNGPEFRALYRKYNADGLKSMRAEDYASGLRLLSTFLTRGNSRIPNEKLLEWVDHFLPAEYVTLKASLPQVLDFGVTAMESFCGSNIDAGFWESRKVGLCLSQTVRHFEPILPWLNYALGLEVKTEEYPQVLKAVQILEDRLKVWFAERNSPAFPLQKIVDLAIVTRVPEPEQFFGFMEWVQAFDPTASQKKIRVQFFVDVAHLISDWHSAILADQIESIGYSKVIRGILKKEKLPRPRYKSWVEDKALSERLRLYQSIRDFVFEHFDQNNSGEIPLNTNKGLVHLTEVVFRFLDGNIFFGNLMDRLLDRNTPAESFVSTAVQKLDLRGLAQVVMVAADLIVEDGNEYRSFWTKIKSHLKSGKENVLDGLDRPRLFAVLVTTDLLDSMTERWSKDYDLKRTADGTVDRRSIVQNFRKILKHEFPEIFESCDFVGFTWSCGMIMNEVLPSVNKGTQVVNISDMQTMALTGLLTQGLLRRCDRNDDGVWANSVVNGYDEKDCVVAGLKNLVFALMDAKIIEKDPKTVRILKLVDSTEVFRWPLKIAMGVGTLKGIGWRALTSVFGIIQKPGSVGTLFRLGGEFMNEECAEAIANDTVGPIKDPGDEILYTYELEAD